MKGYFWIVIPIIFIAFSLFLLWVYGGSSAAPPRIDSRTISTITTPKNSIVYEIVSTECLPTEVNEVMSSNVRGRILDPEGRAIEGALIQVVSLPVGGITVPTPLDVVREGHSDGLGQYTIRELPTNVILTLIVHHAQWAIGGCQLLGLGENETRDNVDIMLSPPLAVSGTVVSDEGVPLAGATVFFQELCSVHAEEDLLGKRSAQEIFELGSLSRPSSLSTMKTDSAGRFQFANLPANHAVHYLGAIQVGYAPGWALNIRGEDSKPNAGGSENGELWVSIPAENIEIVLHKSGAVSGQVVRFDTDLPIANATVQIQGLTRPLGPFSDVVTNFKNTTLSDASGKFVFDCVPHGEMTLHAEVVGMRSKTTRCSVASGFETNEIELKVMAEGVIEGNVYDAKSGLLIAGMLLNYSEGGMGSEMLVAKTNGSGYFRLEGLAPGVVRLGPRTSERYRLNKERHSDSEDASIWSYLKIPVRSASVTRGIKLYCDPIVRNVGKIRGTVSDVAGTRVVGASISVLARGIEATTDDRGEFELSVATPGECMLVASSPEKDRFGYASVIVELEQETEVNILLDRKTAAISGSVYYAGGRAAIVPVSAVDIRGGNGSIVIVPGSDGTYKSVIIPGSYALSPAQANGSYSTEPVSYDINISEGEEINDLDFVLTPMLGHVAGSVFFSSGKPASSLTVVAIGKGITMRGVTDFSGKFFLSPIEGDDLEIQVRVPPDDAIVWSSVSPVSSGDENVEIVLEGLGTLVAQILLPNQRTAFVDISSPDESGSLRTVATVGLAHGEMQLSLRPGEYRLRFVKGDDEVWSDAIIDADHTTDIGEISFPASSGDASMQ